MNLLHNAGSLQERAILVLIEDGQRPRVLTTTTEEQNPVQKAGAQTHLPS